MVFTPREYQEAIIQAIQNNKRCAVWAQMGLGKTISTLTALENLSYVENIYPVLIIAPLRVAESTWPGEVRKWEHTRHLSVITITGTPSERRAALRRKAPIYTINYEGLTWLIAEVQTKWPFKVVVADESTKLKGFRTRQGAKRPKALATVAHTLVKRFIQLTGTPSPNGLKDLWGQIWFLDKGERLGKSYSAFTTRWFRTGPTGFDMFPLPHAQDEIHTALRDVCTTIDAADYFGLKAPIVNKMYLDLPASAAMLYTQMEKEMFIELESEPIEALNAAAKTMKCLQIANGAAYLADGKTWKLIHDEKIKALESIVEEAAGMPILVAYHFKSDLARLQKAYPRGTALGKDPATIIDWNAGKIPVLFAHPASAGHGLNLQDGGNILVFFSVNWNLEEHLQISERIGPVRQLQAGHNRPVFIHFLIATNTIDELILERLESKRSVQEVLISAMKKR